eukprot:TRINITY_DN22164_c0_g1_i1.p2 TRINITY_DN22164_c0_g1~~TRINITY_DN22164_c0_g1_i1.p2  ORF type:complete len:292 (+),score=135.37 TRINITY_DN22164_c0_g1_i1:70-945(+)
MSTYPQCDIALVGGTGVYELEGMENIQDIVMDTPYGKCAHMFVGDFCGEKVVFYSRHGKGHKLLPSEIPFQANIYACRVLGVKYMFTVSACGSLRADYKPGDLVIIDQFIDRTKNRPATFFGNGVVGHVTFGHPVCQEFHSLVHETVKATLPDVAVHPKGTYVCMEGPAFSTQAESRMYRMWGGDIIGMTALTEAKLAREAEIAYSSVGLVTDFDAWKDDEPHAEVSEIMKVIAKNSANAQKFAKAVAEKLVKNKFKSDVHETLASGLMTRGDAVTDEMRKTMGPIFGKYW